MMMTEQEIKEKTKNKQMKSRKIKTFDMLYGLSSAPFFSEKTKKKISKILDKRIKNWPQKYGVPLKTYNGRNTIQDLIEAFADLVLLIELKREELNDVIEKPNNFSRVLTIRTIRDNILDSFEKLLELRLRK